MWIIKALLPLLTGNLAGVVKVIAGTIGKLSDNDTAKFTAAVRADKDVAVTQIQGIASAWHDRVDLLKGMKVTSWLIAAALIPPIYHQALVFLDSCPFFLIPYFSHIQGSWAVASAPAPYAGREQELIFGLLGLRGTMTLGIGALKIWKGK